MFRILSTLPLTAKLPLLILVAAAMSIQALPPNGVIPMESWTASGVDQSESRNLPVAPGVGFTLANRSLKSIPLQIPGVMNPNLSPMSDSGVTLAVGQEVFFFEGKKKYLLLVVGPEFAGQTLIVNQLIKERLEQIRAEEGVKAAAKKRSKS